MVQEWDLASLWYLAPLKSRVNLVFERKISKYDII